MAQAPSLKITGVRNLAGPNGEDAVTEITKTAFVPQTPEAFTHDTDGNLTADARWTYTWDGENRLIALETSTAAATAGVSRQKLEFAYDGQSRRVSKKVSNWSGSAWTLASHTLFLYNGWNLIAELNALASNAVVRTYMWGLDLSGSMQGDGGVGGLLAINDAATSTLHFTAFDGNGNVAGLANAADGTLSAKYDYNAFGEPVLSEGTFAGNSPFRFATKFTDRETGYLYYGYRFYQPETGRWINKDPIREEGGVNVYAFLENDPIDDADPLGLMGVVGQTVTQMFAEALNGARTRVMVRRETSLSVRLGRFGEGGIKYGVIAFRTTTLGRPLSVDVTAYANLYGQLKFPLAFGFQAILEPSIGVAGKLECADCPVGGRWEYRIAGFYCRGDITINYGIKVGIRSPGFDSTILKIYTEGGGYAGWTYSFRRNESRLNGYVYWMGVFDIPLSKTKKVTRRAEVRWGTNVDF